MIIVICLVILVIVIDIMLGLRIENKYKPKENRDNCIVDILQENLPDLTENKLLCKHTRDGILKNIFSLDDILAIIIFFILIYLHGSKYFIDIGILFIFIGTLRIITKTITILPQSNKKCKAPDERNSIDRYITGGCNDSIFSGHMSLMLLMLLFINKGIKKLYIKIMMLLFAIIYSFFIIMLRNHYSVDIVLAWYITISAFIIYENRGSMKYFL